jgi:hypothetical protein
MAGCPGITGAFFWGEKENFFKNDDIAKEKIS